MLQNCEGSKLDAISQSGRVAAVRMATERTRHNAPPDLSVRGVSLCFPNAPTLLQESPQPRKLEGGAAKVQPSYGIQYVDLDAFYPPKS